MPPVAPMLAKPAAAIPAGQLYEPKWDGFRSIIFRDGDEVEIGSRKERPLTRYFPEVIEASVLGHDGALVVRRRGDAAADGTLSLNGGCSAGVKVGDKLSVKRVGRKITDPATGKVLRSIEDALGEVTITEVDASSSVGKFSGSSPPNCFLQ